MIETFLFLITFMLMIITICMVYILLVVVKVEKLLRTISRVVKEWLLIWRYF